MSLFFIDSLVEKLEPCDLENYDDYEIEEIWKEIFIGLEILSYPPKKLKQEHASKLLLFYNETKKRKLYYGTQQETEVKESIITREESKIF